MNVTALDESGRPVDWWFMYKVPLLGAGTNNDAATGYEYVYYDSKINTANGKVDKSAFTSDGGKGALNRTLDSVFKNPSSTTGWILYNDEGPEGAKIKDDGNLGHTKGVLAFDTSSGTAYWLLTSGPRSADPAAVRDPTPKYGQTYRCLTLDIATASKIAKQMATHQEPQTFLNRMVNVKKTDPLYLLTQKLDPNAPASTDVLKLKTTGGLRFWVIAKNRDWNKDFWNELVGPELGEDMDVETWIRGPIPPIADSDGVHKTFDIKYINLGAMGAHWVWPETHDHAKWGITLKSNWICVGDINRMISQRKRGGGTIAFQNQTLWTGLTKTSFLLAPPGLSRTDAHTVLEATHVDHHKLMQEALGTMPAAPAKRARKVAKKATKKAVRKKTAKKVAKKGVRKTARKKIARKKTVR